MNIYHKIAEEANGMASFLNEPPHKAWILKAATLANRRLGLKRVASFVGNMNKTFEMSRGIKFFVGYYPRTGARFYVDVYPFKVLLLRRCSEDGDWKTLAEDQTGGKYVFKLWDKIPTTPYGNLEAAYKAFCDLK